jgi:hypothetical protein
MKRLATMLLLTLPLLLSAAPDPHDAMPPQVEPSVRFTWVDAYIDPHGKPLAAYQFELTARGPGVTLVGVEGGEHPAYAEPPYYDPRANLQNRIVIAAFNTGDDLPRARTRVARIMIRETGNAKATYTAKLDVAASIDSKPLNATISVSEGASQ